MSQQEGGKGTVWKEDESRCEWKCEIVRQMEGRWKVAEE